MQHLQPNTTLQGGKYRIERVLGQGGFGNTYSGYNTVFDERVAIKEFFMQGINDRDGNTGSISVSLERNLQQFEEQREKFKKEALRIRKLSNPHIIKVHDLFEENGTVYYVMDFVDGENLAERLKRTGAPLNETEVQNILPQLLDALKTVHDAGIWHLDLKPANILIDKTGNVKLIDFGASKQFNAQKGGATTSTAISYTNGYAPR
jgi:serine/threonine-protein kinase